MAFEWLVFDLDGTLSDPKEGIVQSTNFALTACGYDPVPPDAVDEFIGPPLDYAFKQLTGSKDSDHLRVLIDKYREAYARKGYAQNQLYPEIPEVLEILSNKAVSMGVCTSKRVDFAESILKLHRIRHHFKFVDGGDVGIPKWRQLQTLLQKGHLSTQTVMIGDRNVDLTAAHRNGLDAAGVLWGYGSRAELEGEDPAYLFKDPLQLVELASR